MKRIDLVRHLESQGCQLIREGRQHSLYINRQTGNPPPCRAIEKSPREQFEAFAGLLGFRRRSETSRQFYSEYDSRETPFAIVRI
jgi:hypothetical protein